MNIKLLFASTQSVIEWRSEAGDRQDYRMTNIPTDLLRTFVTVADVRSFTRAAQAFGITQPAVSAQIKRLQTILGVELLDKSAPGVTLTPKGELFVTHARRLLSINDQMVDLSSHRTISTHLHIGILGDYFESAALGAIARFRENRPDIQVRVETNRSDALMRDLRNGDYDLVLGAAETEPQNAVRRWIEPTAWAAAPGSECDPTQPVRLVVLNESGLTHRMAAAALEEAGREYRITYIGGSVSGMLAAVAAGFGVVNFARRALLKTGLKIIDEGPRLPRLPPVHGGVFLRDSLHGSEYVALAGEIADAIIADDAEAFAGARAQVV